MRLVPMPLTGPGAQFAPIADRAVRSTDDPHRFTGHLWLMSAGAWQVRVTASGDRGEGTLSVDAEGAAGEHLAPAAVKSLAAGQNVVIDNQGARPFVVRVYFFEAK